MRPDLSFRLWRHMKRIRTVEEKIAARYPEGRMRCPTHLSIGQESVPAAVAECLTAGDLAVSTHRGHAHYLAKGGSLNAMMAEIYGKADGCSGGKGGSMHLIDLDVGFMGTSPIVGNSIPIGVGLGLSLQLQKSDRIACVFLGDGAVEEGVFYESVNFAAVRNLPVLFLCENNLYSVYSPLKVRQPPGRSIAAMTAAMGIATATGNGSDVLECHALISEKVKAMRAGGGPCLLEFSTYRWREHCGPHYDNDLGYRSVEEFESWKKQDPLAHIEPSLAAADIAAAIEAINREVDDAFTFAEQSAFPQAAEAYTGEYA